MKRRRARGDAHVDAGNDAERRRLRALDRGQVSCFLAAISGRSRSLPFSSHCLSTLIESRLKRWDWALRDWLLFRPISSSVPLVYYF